MKLYIWHDPYAVDYGASLLIVAAENLRDAKEQATAGGRYSFGFYEGEAAEWRGRPKLGKPNRVLNLPCAEWHKWSE